MKPATKITVIFLTAVALVHLARLIFGWEAVIGGWTFPVWGSVFGVLIPGALAYLVAREHKG